MVNETESNGASSSSFEALPPCVVVLGMAGSGKTTFVQRLASYLHSNRSFPYLLNLDPAVGCVPFPANIDIRDTVDYKGVMKEYGLGPNGAILTCLNLLCTKFDQVLSLLEKRISSVPYIILDTPGQIEVFTWSVSGSIITGSLADKYPTIIAYVVDSARSVNPRTFMSNMLYACSILYRTKLPFFLVFNKSDIVSPDFAVSWMNDFEKFQEALDESESCYANDLTRSLSLVLDSFYQNLNWVAVSSQTGEGFEKVNIILNNFLNGHFCFIKCKINFYIKLIRIFLFQ
ncbi:GPN-loop GTPase [Meloidogyne graminicola]|uniref:GPN-loop GTPase n=1 Tax=Meloidogyne graminicola TaxID=189291 RepID=A0A8S9ZT24_9BILA|nr:GPN-loop GTPase [Meloidogyne graminicola]